MDQLATEKHYKIEEIAGLWGMCEKTVRSMFRGEPGVLRVHRPAKRGKREYTSLRIPQSVMERVHRRERVAQ